MVMALDITDLDHWTFNEGTHVRAYEVLGAHPIGPSSDGSGAPRVAGVTFRVWAPNARRVAVVGSFDDWNPTANDMSGSSSGIWETTVPHARVGDRYKFRITPRQGEPFDKADPFAAAAELAPATASVIADLSYAWADDEWMQTRASHNDRNAPLSVYELHLGSWSYFAGGTYRSIAPKLADHVERMGFTHVELLPIMEHPFYGSWGYQTTGYFAPTARYGSPQDFMWFVDHLHQRGIGVILDWVPSHFPDDAHGLASFDGTHLFEHADPRLGYHPDWHSLIFNYDRHEISSFLVSSALSWLDRYHVDGLRVDAVASMLYRDYSREPGEWIPNEHGGRENLGAITFLQRLNRAVYDRFPDVQTFAEESTAFPMVSRPVHAGGLGFGFKWDMGWMHDSLQFCELDPVHRKYHYGELTFRSVYANSENFILPLSHDEVVHGKGSLLDKQAGSGSPDCACCTGTSSPRRARSCSSWGRSSHRTASGTTRRTCPGACSSAPSMKACGSGSPTSTSSIASHPRSTSATTIRGACSGSSSTTVPTACSPSSGGQMTASRCCSSATSPPSSATATRSVCPSSWPVGAARLRGTKRSTAMRPSTVAVASVTSAPSTCGPSRPKASSGRCGSLFPRWACCCSSLGERPMITADRVFGPMTTRVRTLLRCL
jgi:alpha-1,4-glucan:alpha-1,4-glucan 6-glycosyltransferase